MEAQPDGIVYLLRHGETRTYKIGKTHDSKKRKKALSTGNPEELHLIKQWAVTERHAEFEKLLHLTFAEYRLRRAESTEFFIFDHLPEAELIAAIDGLHQTFLARIEAFQDCDQVQTGPGLIDADADLELLVERRRQLATRIRLLEMECGEVDARLKQRIGGNAGVRQAGRPRPLVTWKTVSTARFDVHKFKSEYPEMYADFANALSFRTFRVHE